MKFLATNLVTETSTVITGSSENANFPASNLSSPFRSKKWRSSGTFIIDSTNNKINFKDDSGGGELTATITSGEYSVSELETEIETQMAAVGAHTYTASYSTATGLWTISTDHTYLALLNATGTNVAVSLLVISLGFAGTDVTASTSYTGSLIAIHTSEYVKFDFLTSQDISSIVILWPKDTGIRLSETATLTIQANATDVWTSPAVSQSLTIDNTYESASYHWATVQSYRYWRLVITDPENADLYVEVGMTWIGENVSFDEPENGFKYKLEDNSEIDENKFGHSYVDEYPLLASLEFSYKYISYSTLQALENAFRSNGRRKPVLVVFDETEQVFDKDHIMIYGRMGKDFAPDHVMYDIFSGGLKITELG